MMSEYDQGCLAVLKGMLETLKHAPHSWEDRVQAMTVYMDLETARLVRKYQ